MCEHLGGLRMFSRIKARLSFANVTSVIALFFAVGGTSAYAINEWTGANIQDETLTGNDVKGTKGTTAVKGTNGSLTGADISGQQAIPEVGQTAVNGSIKTHDIQDGGLRGVDIQGDTLTGTQIKDGSVTNPDIATGAIDGSSVADESLTSSDLA